MNFTTYFEDSPPEGRNYVTNLKFTTIILTRA